MKSVVVQPYKNEQKSQLVYLGQIKVKAIEFQRTESKNMNILDLVFTVPLENDETCEFLIRLETSIEEIHNLKDKIDKALANPKPHPWEKDLFHYAVTGMFPFDQLKDLFEE